MNAKAHRYGKEREKHPDIPEEILKTATVYFFISNPVTPKKDNCADGKKGNHIKIPTVCRIVIFNI